MTATTYTRRISAGEAAGDEILVLKRALAFFPEPGHLFRLEGDGRGQDVAVEAERCECRGPDRPHEHFRIPWAGLASGSVVEIERPDPDVKRYVIRVRD